MNRCTGPQSETFFRLRRRDRLCVYLIPGFLEICSRFARSYGDSLLNPLIEVALADIPEGLFQYDGQDVSPYSGRGNRP